MFKRCYLHIGMPRTGSTAIQASLGLNRDELATLDRHIPTIDTATDHAALAVYARDAMPHDALHARFVSDGDGNGFAARMEAWADALAADGSDDREVILSSEHLYEQITTQAGWEKMAALIRRFAHATTVIVYLRRQDRVAISITGAAVRAGAGLEVPLLPDLTEGLPYIFCYSSVIRTLRAVFAVPGDAVVARPLEEHAAQDADIVRDFYSIVGVPEGSRLKRVGRVNESLSHPAQIFLARFNSDVPVLVEGVINEARSNIGELLSKVPGPRRLPTRARAKRFVGAFAEDNALTLELLQPDIDRAQLFDNDFSDYPEGALDRALSVQQAVKIAAYLWQQQAIEINKLRRALAELEGAQAPAD